MRREPQSSNNAAALWLVCYTRRSTCGDKDGRIGVYGKQVGTSGDGFFSCADPSGLGISDSTSHGTPQ